MASIKYQQLCNINSARHCETRSPSHPDKPMDIPPNPYRLKPSPRRIPRPRPVPPTPAKFNFGFTERNPLVPLAAAAMLLNRTTREVLALLEDGQLRWGFDIRTRESSRREVRILRQSLFECAGLCEMPANARGNTPEFQKIIDLILPEEVIMGADGADWKTEARPGSARNFQTEARLAPVRYNALNLPKEPVLRATEIAECFSCNTQHVTNLINDDLFQLLEMPIGPKASPFVTRESVMRFLEGRRIS